MSKRTKIILLSMIIILSIIIVAVILWLNANKHEMENESTRIGEAGTGVGGIINQESGIMNGKEGKEGGEARVKEAVVLSAEEIEEENLKAMAASFVERWGSWSTDGDYSNFNSLKVQMTEEMKKFADAEVLRIINHKSGIINHKSGIINHKSGIRNGEEGKLGGEVFYGITTKALSANVKEKDDSNAVLTVIVQKSINENGTVNVAYAEVKLEMVKEGDRWVVSRIH